MPKRRKGIPHKSRRHRMKREVRLTSARGWLRTAGPVRAGGYAARYGVDRYIAYKEMLELGATIAEGDRKYAVRPQPVPKRRRAQREDEPLTLGVIEWGGELILPMGYTSGGAPYGVMGEELEELLRDFEAERSRIGGLEHKQP